MPLFARTRERQGFAQDVIALQQFLQQQQLAGRTQLPAGQAGPIIAPQFPRPQSQAGAELFSDFLLNKQAIAGRATLAQAARPGFTLGQTRFDASGRPIAQVPAEPFTLTPGAERFTAAGQRVAGTPITQKPITVSPGQRLITPEGKTITEVPSIKAGPLQIAKAGDISGLPEGTVFQADKEGNISIISEPNLLTFDEQRKRDLIAGGLQAKEVSELEKRLTRSVIKKNRAESEARLRAAKGILTPEQKISQANVFRKEFDALAKDFRTIRDSFGRMKAAAVDPSGAGDIAVIFNFMKILDPGSVVRESEFATAENAAGVPDAIRNLWNKALTGEKIAFNRDDFLNTAQRLIKSQESIQRDLIRKYTGLSKRYGLNPQDIITEVIGQQQFTTEQIEAELQRRGVK